MLVRRAATRTALRRGAGATRSLSGKSPTLYFPPAGGKNVQKVTDAAEWTKLLSQNVGTPLLYFYRSRYPQQTAEDVQEIKNQLNGDLNSFYGADWEAKYAELEFPEWMYHSRRVLNAEINQNDLAAITGITDEDDPYTSIRADYLKDQQKIDAQYQSLLAEVNNQQLPAPQFDWDSEYNSALDREALEEKRRRYDTLSNTSLQWDKDLFNQWDASYNACRNDLEKDRDIDYLRETELRVQDHLRNEYYYQRVAHLRDPFDGVARIPPWTWYLLHPEITDTIEADEDAGNLTRDIWEFVSEGNLAHDATVVAQMIPHHKEVAKSMKGTSLPPSNPLEIFRAVPHQDFAFLAATNTCPVAKALCQEIADQLAQFARQEAAGETPALEDRMRVSKQMDQYELMTAPTEEARVALYKRQIQREITAAESLGLDSGALDKVKEYIYANANHKFVPASQQQQAISA
eukprot:TRINITY_DN67176_c3_g1_i1.p1 TRINITY_DN67176_c3_g1~~TRINITY_DN67176_c3_g1_i1.p1  ORF type:complete len:461 (-),score=67.36 TRINITY_DN67176_c3_g1_i1:868-2250(-)